MANQYVYNNYQYSPNMGYSTLNGNGNSGSGSSSNTSPLFNNMNYVSPTGSSYSSSSSTGSSSGSGSGSGHGLSGSSNGSSSSTSGTSVSDSNGNGQGSVTYSFHTPRLRYYLSKSFDIEDDLEFCPDIPEQSFSSSPSSAKKFNPYTATVFSPSQEGTTQPTSRVHTPRIKKPLEIINPSTKLRVGSPATSNK